MMHPYKSVIVGNKSKGRSVNQNYSLVSLMLKKDHHGDDLENDLRKDDDYLERTIDLAQEKVKQRSLERF
jgi:hypothetical protein